MPPRSRPPNASPTEIFPFPIGTTPTSDRAYFEMLTWFVFAAGLNWKILRAKWPNFDKAFRKFNYTAVAKFNDDDVDRLLANAGIIRHGKKVTSAIENAREVQAIVKEYGSMTAWVRSYRSDAPLLIKDTKKRFHHIGPTTARLFLTCAGAIEYQTWVATARQRGGEGVGPGPSHKDRPMRGQASALGCVSGPVRTLDTSSSTMTSHCRHPAATNPSPLLTTTHVRFTCGSSRRPNVGTSDGSTRRSGIHGG